MSTTTKQFVYAQQDILGGTQKTNDLVVVNDADYRDSGICVGPGGALNNMRLAYSVSDSAGSITTDTLNVNVEQLYFKNLPSAQNVSKSCNYLVADASGNVKEGYPQFRGDINGEVNSIKSDIILIKENLGLPVVKTITIESILSYIAIGLCVLFLIILVILLIRLHRLNKRLEVLEANQAQQEMAPPPQNYLYQQAYAPSPRYGYQPPPPPQAIYQPPPPPPQQMAPPPPQTPVFQPPPPPPQQMAPPPPQAVVSPTPPASPPVAPFTGYRRYYW